MHHSLKFTLDIEENNQIPFLYVLVIHDGNHIKSLTFRKQTWSRRYLHLNSFVPFSYKTGLIRTLFDWMRKICSHEFINEVKNFLTKILQINGYSLPLIEKHSQPYAPKPFGPEK